MPAIFLLILIALGIGFRFLPWEWKLGVVAVAVLAGLFLREKLLIWLFMLAFRWKGKTLRKATIQVHGLTPTEKPPEAEPEPIPADEEDGPPAEPPPPEPARRYFVLDVTISPTPRNSTPFLFWEVGELSLVTPEEDVMRKDGNDSCVIYSNTVERPAHVPPPEPTPEGEEVDDDYGYKVAGPHRVRFVIGVKYGVRELNFQYYFERFGEVLIP